MRVADILRHKGRDVRVVAATAPVLSAIETMVSANVGALVVLNEGSIVGMLTERDYLRRIVLHPASSRQTPVGDVMSSPVIFATPDLTVEECMALMTEYRIRHLPVIDGNVLVGIVSMGDLVKLQSKEHEVQIRYLHEYITAR